MSTLAANNITDAAGTGGPTLANGLTIGTSPLAAPSGSAPSYTCRAWVNFTGTGTVTINEDGNVTSITDNGTGDYTVNFTTAMPDAKYAVTASCQQTGGTLMGAGIYSGATPLTSSSARIVTGYANNGTQYDAPIVCVLFSR
jgi:hypothetical protein